MILCVHVCLRLFRLCVIKDCWSEWVCNHLEPSSFNPVGPIFDVHKQRCINRQCIHIGGASDFSSNMFRQRNSTYSRADRFSKSGRLSRTVSKQIAGRHWDDAKAERSKVRPSAEIQTSRQRLWTRLGKTERQPNTRSVYRWSLNGHRR